MATPKKLKTLSLADVFEQAQDALEQPFDLPESKNDAIDFLKRSASLNHYFGQTACAMQIEAVITWLEQQP